MAFEVVYLSDRPVLIEKLNVVLYPGTPEYDVFVPYIGRFYNLPLAWWIIPSIARSAFLRTPLAISTWVRDALNKDTERQKEEIRRLNKDVIHGGDMRSDAMVVTEGYKKSSTVWRSFRTLYGLTLDNVNDLGIVYKFP
ncbi:hypothetical protein N7533_011135 [Penicillium manginii]|uniref:uncharacterized protein n=1 Tax=Penicillium manginii TaxID=203109 RepID=UPI002547093E|nr:uncharacterized protein N7533_011135 [Penicillium manginii]KAJ5741726.1 hypothetical protein N7533_011135 [Penicillium manginii]